MRSLWMMAVAGVLLVAGARAQSTNINRDIDTPSTALGSQSTGGVVGQNAMVARQQVKLAEAAEAKNRTRMVDDSTKLLQLATELQNAVDKSNKDQLSLDVVRKAEEIEKLAHQMKLKMKNQS
jgi:hypothetical protein